MNQLSVVSKRPKIELKTRSVITSVILLLLLSLFLLSGCTGSVKNIVDADARVKSFTSLFPQATYTDMAYSGKQVEAIRDVVHQDCGKVSIPSSLTRATYVSKVATLTAYINENNTLFCVASKLNPNAFTIEKGNRTTVENGTLLTVDGDPITMDEVRNVIQHLPKDAKNQTVATVLNTLVNQRLLKHAANSVTIGDEDLASAITNYWKGAGFDDKASFERALTKRNSSYGQFTNVTLEQLKIERLLKEKGVTDVNISDEATQKFYLNNPNSFLISEQVRFRQIFINFNKSGGKELAKQRLQKVLASINESKDFCSLVRQYSDDTTSKERCGEYLTPRGVLSPELESALFSLAVNKSTVVKSGNGYHIILVLAHQPTTVIPFSQAEEQVRGLLKNNVVQQRLNIFLLKLRANAKIVDYT